MQNALTLSSVDAMYRVLCWSSREQFSIRLETSDDNLICQWNFFSGDFRSPLPRKRRDVVLMITDECFCTLLVDYLFSSDAIDDVALALAGWVQSIEE